MSPKKASGAATPFQVRDVLFDDPARVTDAQLLVLVLGTGTTRQGKGQVRKIWPAMELANDLLAESGGRLEHLVASACRDDFDLRHFGLGRILGSRIVAAMELAHRWRRGFKRGGNPAIRTSDDDDLALRILKRKVRLTEGELVAVLLSSYLVVQKEVGSLLAAYASPEDMMKALTPAAFQGSCDAGTWRWLGFRCEFDSACRLLAAIELARRHRARAGIERYALKPGSFGLTSDYLIKLLDPESPIDLPRRRSLLEQTRSNPRMTEDFTKLDQLASDAQADSFEAAIKLHVMFEALRENREWTRPAEVLGEPVPYRCLLSIAEARIDRATGSPTRILKVRDLLKAAESAAIREPISELAATLIDLEISESGMERSFEQVRHLIKNRGFSAAVAVQEQESATGA